MFPELLNVAIKMDDKTKHNPSKPQTSSETYFFHILISATVTRPELKQLCQDVCILWILDPNIWNVVQNSLRFCDIGRSKQFKATLSNHNIFLHNLSYWYYYRLQK